VKWNAWFARKQRRDLQIKLKAGRDGGRRGARRKRFSLSRSQTLVQQGGPLIP
jgi:hypothetical protein